MTNASPSHLMVLLARLGTQLYAIPLASVIECLRPLPTEVIPQAPPFITGLSVIRGAPVPVVNLGALLGMQRSARPGRFVLLRLDQRRLVLTVEDVIGVRRLNGDAFQSLPPILQSVCGEAVSAIGVRDEQLLFLLRLARIVPAEVWQALESVGGHR